MPARAGCPSVADAIARTPSPDSASAPRRVAKSSLSTNRRGSIRRGPRGKRGAERLGAGGLRGRRLGKARGEERLEHLRDDRGRGGSAVASVLDDDGERDLGLLGR